MSVYFLEAVGLNLVKIGSTNRVTARFVALQAACPVEVRMLKVTKGRRRDEVALHKRFAEHRVRFEWFKLAPLRDFIASLPDDDPALCDRIPRGYKSLREVRKLVTQLLSEAKTWQEREHIRQTWFEWKKGTKITDLNGLREEVTAIFVVGE